MALYLFCCLQVLLFLTFIAVLLLANIELTI